MKYRVGALIVLIVVLVAVYLATGGGVSFGSSKQPAPQEGIRLR